MYSPQDMARGRGRSGETQEATGQLRGQWERNSWHNWNCTLKTLSGYRERAVIWARTDSCLNEDKWVNSRVLCEWMGERAG